MTHKAKSIKQLEAQLAKRRAPHRARLEELLEMARRFQPPARKIEPLQPTMWQLPAASRVEQPHK